MKRCVQKATPVGNPRQFGACSHRRQRPPSSLVRAFTVRAALYATGGLAYGRLDFEGTRTVSGSIFAVPFSITRALGHSQVNTVWTVGAGLEGALIGNWTLKAEYLYMDLGALDDSDLPPVTTINSVTGGQATTHTHFTDNIFRVGLNYQFH